MILQALKYQIEVNGLGINGISIKKGYLKIHLAVDIKKKKVLSIKISNEKVHDGNQLKHLVDDVS